MLSQDFDAFEDDCSDGVCQDIDGKRRLIDKLYTNDIPMIY